MPVYTYCVTQYVCTLLWALCTLGNRAYISVQPLTVMLQHFDVIYECMCYDNISTITLRHEMFHCLHCFINAESKSGQHRTVDYFEDDYYVKSERDTPSNGHHIKSQVFRNRNFDSGGRSFSNEGTRFGSRSSQDRGSNRSSRPYVDDQSHQNRFSDDLILKVNSGDIGRIIGMLNKQ